jgi:hypothetical protein
MTPKSKIAVLVTLAAIGVASPAFAQPFDPDIGTGNVLSLTDQSTASYAQALPAISVHQKRVANRHEGHDAFAMAPRAQRGSVADNPADTGGGSLGYNEELKNY